jgi:predicted metal-dependent phosphoesterase TrpH
VSAAPVRLDLHVHSRHSPDSRLAIAELVDWAPRRGLRGFALTDHNSVAGHAELEALGRAHPGLILIPGVEVSTLEGHLLALGVTELPPVGASVEETVTWVGAHGGVPVPSHASRRVHGIGLSQAARLNVPALEVLNGHTSGWGNARVARLATARRVGATGGSDVHDLRDLGRCYTEFSSDTGTREAVLAALRGGSCRAGGRPLSPVERLGLFADQLWARVRRGGHGI